MAPREGRAGSQGGHMLDAQEGHSGHLGNAGGAPGGRAHTIAVSPATAPSKAQYASAESETCPWRSAPRGDEILSHAEQSFLGKTTNDSSGQITGHERKVHRGQGQTSPRQGLPGTTESTCLFIRACRKPYSTDSSEDPRQARCPAVTESAGRPSVALAKTWHPRLLENPQPGV